MSRKKDRCSRSYCREEPVVEMRIIYPDGETRSSFWCPKHRPYGIPEGVKVFKIDLRKSHIPT